ncbi:hypothetical protein GF327_09760 [Candidatus Woesearchaeota archaeon]|nr:hypothetical protein [Candidatus Woesearchaeota archaeon]
MRESALKRFGLSDKETKVYLSCLELSSASVTEISQKSGVYRTLCYEVLDSLMHQGLVSYTIKQNKKYYQAASPEKLVSILKEKEEVIKSVLPELKKLHEYNKEPVNVEIFKDKEGIKTILMDSLKTKSEIKIWELNKIFKKKLPIYSQQYKNEIKKNKIRSKIFATEEKNLFNLPNNLKKIIPKNYSTPVTTFTYDSKVAMIIFEPSLIGILINSSDISDHFKERFNLIWDQNILVYNGKEEVKEAIWAQVKSKTTLKIFGAKARFSQIYPEFSKKYIRYIDNNSIKTKILYPKGRKVRVSKNTQARFVSKKIQHPVSITLYDNKVHLLIWEPEPQSILIKNLHFHNLYENYFDMLWKDAEKNQLS